MLVPTGGYAYASAHEHLINLTERLKPNALEQLTDVLERSEQTPQPSVLELQTTLAAMIPLVISVLYHPDGSENDLKATVRSPCHYPRSLPLSPSVPSA